VTTNRISITRAKQRLGELVKRAAYGGERFILQFRGKPQAAVVSYADFEDLQRLEPTAIGQEEALERLHSLRERIAARTGEAFDSAREVEEVREEGLDRLTGLRR
jgi:prevent-host-death family protein